MLQIVSRVADQLKELLKKLGNKVLELLHAAQIEAAAKQTATAVAHAVVDTANKAYSGAVDAVSLRCDLHPAAFILNLLVATLQAHIAMHNSHQRTAATSGGLGVSMRLCGQVLQSIWHMCHWHCLLRPYKLQPCSVMALHSARSYFLGYSQVPCMPKDGRRGTRVRHTVPCRPTRR